MRLGFLQNYGEPGASISPPTMQRLGASFGDYVEIQSEEHGTVICREITEVITESTLDDDYVYVDCASMKFLGASVREEVELKVTPVHVNVP